MREGVEGYPGPHLKDAALVGEALEKGRSPGVVRLPIVPCERTE